jgi:predicted nuclease with TOPRIM domain
LYDTPKDLETYDTVDTYHHLFAVEPELEGILWHVFNEEKVAGKISKLEHEKKVATGKLEKCLESLTQTRQEKSKLEENLKDALSTNASLNDRYLSTNDELFDLRWKVNNFCEYNVFKRLWITFRNDLTPFIAKDIDL